MRAVVVGGGYIGLEMAEAMKTRGMSVTIVEAAAATDVDARPRHGRARGRCDPRTWASTCTPTPKCKAFETDADDHVRAVVTADQTFPADIVVLGIGVKPNSDAGSCRGDRDRRPRWHRDEPAAGDERRRRVGRR